MTVERDDAIVTAFLEESRENLDTFDEDLMALEAGEDIDGRTARLFRTLHTIKGTCGFLALPRLEALAHAGESALGGLRDDRVAPTPAVVRSLLDLGDRIRHAIDGIKAGAGEGQLDGEDARVLAAVGAAVTGAAERPASSHPAKRTSRGWERRAGPDSSLRVDVGLLDRLMNLVGELVLTRNQVLVGAATAGDPWLQAVSGQLDKVTAELQDAVTRTRLRPVGTLFPHLPRLVHDLCAELGKRATLVVDGEDTLIDKAVLDAVRDALTHLVRNAVDHGIETPGARRAAGKPAEGRVVLRAFREGGQAVIEIEDDGAGIDTAALGRRAAELGLRTDEDPAGERLTDLVFQPGVSTRAEVTSVSGRGVGGDVVRANVGDAGGTIEVDNRPGLGATFRIRIPITLSIVSALLVMDGGVTYAVPQTQVENVVRLADGAGRPLLSALSGVPMLRLRGDLLPVLDLAATLGDPARERPDPHLVVVSVASRRVGLLVDGVRDIAELVVKPLGAALRRIPAYAGASVLGDGSVAMILDVAGLVAHSGLADDAAAADAELPLPDAPSHRDVRSYVLARDHADAVLAVPLDVVLRLDRVPAAEIDGPAGLRAVAQRGDILPLVAVGQAPNPDSTTWPAGGAIPVVVCRSTRGPVGLVVQQIDDIVHDEVTAMRPGTRDGVSATVLIGGKVAEVLDVERMLEPAESAVGAA